ncbi:MAG: pseudouridine-5-phosphate glycosidase [Cryomorphaceae bacterium]|nr:pseudouridine-5-phosphate glycosidase [Cryomorphaceae bacterium]
MRNRFLNVSDEVADAQSEGLSIVALESTIIAHGMPFPENLETGSDLESIIRSHGAVPATIAVFDGKICVGLSNEQLHRLATEKCMKLSRRDLPFALAQKSNGATTVSATMIGAALAGIRVFATGGIGGVHRGAETSFDISADLTELAQTPVAVVCAGAKSMLDLPKTLEYLETQGVPVIGYQTSEFPAFYTQKSGLVLEMSAQSPDDVAAMLNTMWQLGYPGGAIVANPIDAAHAIPHEEIEMFIGEALSECEGLNIRGKAVTPFLLKRVAELTSGRSLTANKALVRSNARLAAQVAVALTSAE